MVQSFWTGLLDERAQDERERTTPTVSYSRTGRTELRARAPFRRRVCAAETPTTTFSQGWVEYA
ncbi:hypothetical protein EXIGLDRAFT_380512 [Exidia glandulosa HHB12029]|uniref:Uncharacterized protein n=1 Tax=Exidia glandulosa HHB12029 TaxID=1314781 RepID=A0A165BZT4_EXIGL|nr:hypothetical protein EXIGLDRAFT_380512 [Exidia glandulosa HHB12029]